MHQWLEQTLNLDLPIWVMHIILAAVVTVLARVTVGVVMKVLLSRALDTHKWWDDAFVEAAHKPAVMFIWVFGIGWIVEVIDHRFDTVLLDYAPTIQKVLLVALVSWVLIAFVNGVERRYLEMESIKRFDQTTAVALARLCRVIVLIIAVLVLLQGAGYSISGLLAFGGVGGLAVGFAAKDMLANFIGGWMIYVDRPFKVGDWISSPEKEIEGTVEYIGWRHTRILTFARRPLYVPNSTFMNIVLENPSRMRNRRIKQTFFIRHSDNEKVPAILQDIRDHLCSLDELDQTKTLMVNFLNFGPFSLECQIYCFTKTLDWSMSRMIQESVMLDVLRIVKAHGCELAFPTRTLHFPEDRMDQFAQAMAPPENH